MFGLQLETQREDETLRVLLALTDQEHAAAQTVHLHMETLQDCSRTLCLFVSSLRIKQHVEDEYFHIYLDEIRTYFHQSEETNQDDVGDFYL